MRSRVGRRSSRARIQAAGLGSLTAVRPSVTHSPALGAVIGPSFRGGLVTTPWWRTRSGHRRCSVWTGSPGHGRRSAGTRGGTTRACAHGAMAWPTVTTGAASRAHEPGDGVPTPFSSTPRLRPRRGCMWPHARWRCRFPCRASADAPTRSRRPGAAVAALVAVLAHRRHGLAGGWRHPVDHLR